MTQRLDYQRASPEALQALIGLELAVLRLGLEPRLLQLVKLRASQINGCAYCLDLEMGEAQRGGESAARLSALGLWRDSRLFSASEQAALAWTEALTHMQGGAAIEQARTAMEIEFGETQVAEWTMAIAAINCWNRVGVGFRKPIL